MYSWYNVKTHKEWICKACQSVILDARISNLSMYNKMGSVGQPLELNLCPMEERFIVLRTPLHASLQFTI